MKTCDQYLNAIGEVVDGTLGPLRRAELDLHLESCDQCRALVDDLMQVARSARALDPMDPPGHVWAGIASRLEAEGRVRRTAWRVRRSHTMLALAATLVLAVGAAIVLLLPEAGPDTQPVVTVRVPDDSIFQDPVESVASELALTERHFQNAIEQASRPDALVSAETTAVLQKNLLVVNQAIAESRAALESNPDSTPARQSLYEALKQKIQFLQDTIALMNVMRQGDAAGAAELVESGQS